MLATLAAIQMLLLTQTKVADPAPEPAGAVEAQSDAAQAPADAAPAQTGDAPQAPAVAPPLPSRAPARVTAPAQPPTQPSLLSAQPLQGGSAGLAWFGWSSLGAMYGQGITATDDLGALFDYDWTTTEMRLGAWYRRPLGTAGPWAIAGRLGASWYLDFGTHWAYTGNHSDRGIQLSPGLVFSMPGAGGVFSVAGDLPITVTIYQSGGLLLQPRASVAYETPLYDPISVGILGSVGYRAGSGTAPMKSGRGEFQLLLMAGYRFF